MLKGRNHKIVDVNKLFGRGEVDLISRVGDKLYFWEVRVISSKNNLSYGISNQKVARFRSAVYSYCSHNGFAHDRIGGVAVIFLALNRANVDQEVDDIDFADFSLVKVMRISV